MVQIIEAAQIPRRCSPLACAPALNETTGGLQTSLFARRSAHMDEQDFCQTRNLCKTPLIGT